MNSRDIALMRLHDLRLWGPPLEDSHSVVRTLCAMQAQEFAYAKWSVAQRAGDADIGAVDRALAEGSILRTHALRPTWHFVAAGDVRWILQLTAPRVHAANAHYYRRMGLDEDLLARTNSIIAKALEGGAELTRIQVGDLLRREGIDAAGIGLAYILIHAELDGVVCSGRVKGKQHTYALLEERVPPAQPMTREEALVEMTRRYFLTRGPATLKDYRGWSSLSAAEARSGLEMVKGELQQEVIEGRAYWFATHPAARGSNSPRIDLVQGYDEYVMSYTESRDVLFGPEHASVWPADRATFYHAILLDGRLVGHWRHALKKDQVIVETELDRPFDAVEEEALALAAARYGRFLGLPVTLSGRELDAGAFVPDKTRA